jgi:hypothetical protein
MARARADAENIVKKKGDRRREIELLFRALRMLLERFNRWHAVEAKYTHALRLGDPKAV